MTAPTPVLYNKGVGKKQRKVNTMDADKKTAKTWDELHKELFAQAAKDAKELHGVSLAEVMSNPDKYEK